MSPGTGAVAMTVMLGAVSSWCPRLNAQSTPLGVPTIVALPKGPDQINLVWNAVANPGYGYLVEIQSTADSRYTSWQELRPIPPAAGYQCDSTITIGGGNCTISDPSGSHVYNPPINGIPYWVTESTYLDPQDGSSAQFIAAGLMPNTSYSFRVRTYSGNTSPVYGAYSNQATAITANYVVRYVSPTGVDTNTGTAADDGHAWRTLSHAGAALGCGQVLIVKGGSYSSDGMALGQKCSVNAKAVVLVNPGDIATIASGVSGADSLIRISGSNIVVDGIVVAGAPAGDYAIVIGGSRNALLNVETHPPTIPMQKNGISLTGDHDLIYHSYLHDAFSPDATQNPSGNGGWVLTVQGGPATANVIWSNHLTRGGHDTSLCTNGCSYNRWLNNIMDGGWGIGFEAVNGSQFNLLEGNFIKDAGQLVTFYKPSIELSEGNNTARRNISVNSKSNALEISALYGGSSAVNEFVYNNIFHSPRSCIFGSQNGSQSAYDGDVYSNNICYKFSGAATDIYLPNTNSTITYNDILATDSNGNPLPDNQIIIWNHTAQADFQYPKTLLYAEQNYNPPFAHNKGLDLPPQFVDETHFDFHLAAASPLIGAGTAITDPNWGTSAGNIDLGAFGIAQVNTSGVTVGTLAINTPSVGPLVVGVAYSQALVASGGAQPYKGWVVSAGNLPPGLELTAGGVLSGTPTTAGSYSFTVQVMDGASRTATQTYSVTIAAGPPTLAANGIVNGASYTGGGLAPGEIVTIFGYSLGPGTGVGLQLDRSGYVTNLLGGVQVTFDGVPAPLIYVQAGQISAIVPYAVSGRSSTSVQVAYQRQTTSAVTVPVAAAAPGIFTNDGSGHGQGAILNQDGTRNGASNPAAVGSYISVYATGEGQTSPPGVDGRPGDSNPRTPVQAVTATIGGMDAPVQYAGGAYALTAGVLQVNLQVPAGVTPGSAVPVVLTIGGISSAAGVTMAVR